MAKKDDFDYEEDVFEDISSSTSFSPKKTRKIEIVSYADQYGSFLYRNIDKIIKGIGFVVAAAVVIVFLIMAFLLVKLDSFFKVIAIAVFVLGLVLGGILLFLIYGLGHIITQNEEIIRRLR